MYKNIYHFNRRFYHVYSSLSSSNDNDDVRGGCALNSQTAKMGREVFEPVEVSVDEFRRMLEDHGARLVARPTYALIARHQPMSVGHTIHDSVFPLHPHTGGIILYDDVEDVVYVGDGATLPWRTSTGPMPHDSWYKTISPDDRPVYRDELEEVRRRPGSLRNVPCVRSPTNPNRFSSAAFVPSAFGVRF